MTDRNTNQPHSPYVVQSGQEYRVRRIRPSDVNIFLIGCIVGVILADMIWKLAT